MISTLSPYETWIQEHYNLSNHPSSYSSVIIPMMRRVFPSILASDIVGIQPMNYENSPFFTMTYQFECDNIIPTKKIELFNDEDFVM